MIAAIGQSSPVLKWPWNETCSLAATVSVSPVTAHPGAVAVPAANVELLLPPSVIQIEPSQYFRAELAHSTMPVVPAAQLAIAGPN
jgi:hypothetical protein